MLTAMDSMRDVRPRRRLAHAKDDGADLARPAARGATRPLVELGARRDVSSGHRAADEERKIDLAGIEIL